MPQAGPQEGPAGHSHPMVSLSHDSLEKRLLFVVLEMFSEQ